MIYPTPIPPTLKNLFCISSILLLLLYNGAYLITWRLQQAYIKREVKTFLQKQEGKSFGDTLHFELKEGNVNSKDFSWEEKNKEFLYKDEMYDVVAMQGNGDSITIRCYKDDKETDFRAKVMKYMAAMGATKDPQTLAKIFIEDFIMEPDMGFEMLFSLYEEIEYFDAAMRLSFCHSDIFPRPPKLGLLL